MSRSPELFQQNITPNSKFQTDRLAHRISWTMAGSQQRQKCLTPAESASRAGTTFLPQEIDGTVFVQSLQSPQPKATAPQGQPLQLRPCKVQNRPRFWQRCGKWFAGHVRRNAEIDSLYPVGDEKQTHTLFSNGSGSKKCLTISEKKIDRIEERCFWATKCG